MVTSFQYPALSSSGCGLSGNWSYGERKFAVYEMRMSYVYPGELLEWSHGEFILYFMEGPATVIHT